MTETELVPFFFEGNRVRVYGTHEAPVFVVADVCRAIGIQNATQAVAALEQDERAMLSIDRQGATNCVTEGGLYTLILRCRDAVKPGTLPHRFRRHVTDKVLPAIRKTGAYSAEVPSTVRLQASVADLQASLVEIKEQIKSLVIAHDPRVSAVDYMAPADIVAKHKIKKTRANQNFCKQVGDRLAMVSAQMEIPVKLCPITGRRLFAVAAVEWWLSNGGLTFIKIHKAQVVTGQPPLPGVGSKVVHGRFGAKPRPAGQSQPGGSAA
jgi:prophage antirepressor-like protein